MFYADKDDGNPISCYKGTNLLTDDQLETIRNNLITARDDLKSQGIDFVLFIAPNKERVYSDEMPDYYGAPAENYAVLQIVNYLRDNTDLNILYPIDEINTAARDLGNNGILYHKTDTHWNELGAYIGSKALLDSMDITIPDYDDKSVTIEETEDVAGDLAGIRGLHSWIEPDKTYKPTGFNEHSVCEDEYDFNSVIRYHASNADQRKLFIHRDSFCTAMAETIGSQFNESVMVHTNSYNRDMIAEEKPDIYVLEIAERYADGTLLNIERVY